MRSRVLALGVCLLVVGCTGPGASSDSTAPIVEWIVTRVSDGSQHTYAATATGAASWGQSWRITLKATDPEGIQATDLGGSAEWTCSSGGVGTKKTQLYAGEAETFQPTSAGTVLTEFPLMLEVSTKMDCPAGATFAGGFIAMGGKASNYQGGATPGALSLKVPSDCHIDLGPEERC